MTSKPVGEIVPGDVFTMRVPRSPAEVAQVLTDDNEWVPLCRGAQEACTPKLRAHLFDAISERWRPRNADVRVTFDQPLRAQCLDRADELPEPIAAALARVLLVQVLEDKKVPPAPASDNPGLSDA